MDPQIIDAQFDRAVQIVQSLPKTGPIQTGYEEKLAMYSLYKQATVGNVAGGRPAMWDMLGRAKWDAWSKHKELGTYEAKWQYVEELLRVLQKYPDKTLAQDLIRELEAYDPSANVLMSGSFSKSHDSDSDSDSEEEERTTGQGQLPQQQHAEGSDDDGSNSGDEHDDQIGEGLPRQQVMSNPNLNRSLLGRPQSSHSSNRYRTPMGGSAALSPPPGPSGPATYMTQSQQLPQPYGQLPRHSGVYIQPQSVQHGFGALGAPSGMSSSVPNVQPMPGFETPSAFPGPSPPPIASGVLPHASGMSVSASGGSSYTNVVHPYPENMYPGHPAYRVTSHHSNSPGQVAGSGQGVVSSIVTGASIRSPLERAVENVQAHLTALQERMDIIEGRSIGGSPYGSFSGGRGGPQGGGNSPLGSPYRSSYFGGAGGGRGRGYESSIWTWLTEFDEDYFGWDHMGLWSTVLSPLARLTKFLGRVVSFLLARRDAEGTRRRPLSPGLAILRRLLLDASFVLLVAYVARRAWRRSGVRRREVIHAVKGVWRAIVGQGTELRQLVEKGV
ncbi:ACBP-domain-containing protein [Fomitiporia mediterranea MF3/22]|uniref:ACBP-domain-containing protein n=1 Tax=Fomitiporia mediterranea (strain MF3/22) TaxID=694068 RepID=UPI00044091B8|nr:ACBP-domain-containing protein [Fomitiporia mediterranea MF3/22]EJD00893.1 ACBP-domain-containing protein [Fomitiporia mediterranea MF3/22]